MIGKYDHINYGIDINVDGAVREIEIMEYIKSYSYKARNESWGKQFVGKTVSMPIKLNENIDNISGAKLSCKHLADGVKRVIVTYNLLLKSYK